MKIDVSSIIRDHLATLHVAGERRVSFFDLILFYICPLGLGFLAKWLAFEARVDAFNASITFFGIFIALLLNIQIGMFAIFQREWRISSDTRIAELQRDLLETRRNLLTELNSNISYLILVSCAGLLVSLVFYTEKWQRGLPPAIMVMLYAHFLLTLVMIVKRAHALFHKEYRDTKF